jgi:chromosome segregation ATPase
VNFENVPSWLIPFLGNVSVALTMLQVLSRRLEEIKKELHELNRDFRNTREEVAALQKSDGFQSAQIAKLDERINKLADYWQNRGHHG